MTIYTPIARLPVMTPADPAVKDSWGLILNAALPCIEQVAAGIATVSLTGLTAYTLSVANDAPDQARNAMLLFTGHPTASCTVTIPSVARIGWVSNQSNQTVILATATAITNLTVPPGASFLYTCDGAAVSSVSIGGAGVLSANAGVSIGNGSTFSAYDSAGVLRPLLDIGTDNWTNLVMGGGTGWRVLNQAGGTALLTILPSGAATFAAGLTVTGPLSIGGTFSVTGTTAFASLSTTGASTFGALTTHAGGINATSFDAGGMQVRISYGTYGAGWRMDGAYVYLLLTASGSPLGTYNTLRPLYVNLATGAVNIDGTGAGTSFGGAITATGNVNTPAVVLSGSAYLGNNQYIYMKDASGTYRSCMNIGSDNYTNAWNGGGAGWRVVNQTGSAALFGMDNAGNAYSNGPTFNVAGALTAGSLGTTGTTGIQALTCTTITATSNVTALGFIGTAANLSGGLNVQGITCNSTSTMVGTIYAQGADLRSGTGFFSQGNSQPNNGWSVACSMVATNGVAGQGFYASSDRRLKTDIADITPADGYAWISKGRARSYIMDGRPAAGFVAQEEIDNGRGAAVVAIIDDRQEFAEGDRYSPAGTRLARRYEHDIAYITAALQGALARIASLESQLAAAG